MERVASGRGWRKKSDGGRVSVLDLFGTAIGCIGMSYDDFCRLTWPEAEAVFRAWAESRDDLWDIMRTQTSLLLQPHLKKGKRLPPYSIVRLARDAKNGKKGSPDSGMDAEEQRKRMRMLAEAAGVEMYKKNK